MDRLAATGEALRDHPIDLAREQFRITVPHEAPPRGYGLIVFVPPWEDNRVPAGWASVLARHGIIFVSPTRAGNDASPLGRREPLAILAAFNVMQRYAVDPDRVYVAGFSGGSRIALRLALAYPDLFRGAFLDAGADPIGGQDLPLPSRALFDRFRGSRLVFFKGAEDDVHLQQARDSIASLRRWCVGDPVSPTQAGLGHDVAPGSALARALSKLERPAPAGGGANPVCRGQIEADLGAALDRVRAAIARGDLPDARRQLADADRRFGGLAAPDSVALAKRIHSAGAAGR